MLAERLPSRQYVIDPLAPFPKRWKDHLGNITVMGDPFGGYVMVRRPGAAPFVLSVRQIFNTEPHPIHGPFVCIEPTKKRRLVPISPEKP